ncbi:hypothetical protein GLOIN_2v1474028 [Rhizophagus irregularis DAOM 181602=DAOM 197198]|uniref:Amine oxidase domain-containing protein n=1 Tax=Rhizophagus irregularis (strain DAOM 181602 / DAOM 197198 / MUCL 43194) TaxID=747089 RepID=A0A2P4QI32_RHIID|nr:hypothetical protein GLOIN_2v1474028 [Rhizophagus irregularis DAOM 181602=DAOM 197198]POG77270.1 hypothetical protein GLOIN_2v1474028 [Rhizophagus irregularis DAOM 181602=DAOM 197198]|eukprot:XP_025184136.1 hypothetical protein GLOIN_2v1474028 [Rhizophagus irregularis DAOM 181602=DAOM 197198]
MSGLFAALLLDIAGLKNIEILECQERVGGRVHTEYFSDNVTKDKLYGELGAMRLPKGTDVVRYFYNNKRDDSNKIMTQGYATNPENFEKLGFTNSIRVYWKEKHGIEKKPGKVYDSPFGVVRQWELPDKLDRNDDIDYIRRRAIRELNYDNSAKIFLKFKSRFWEKDSRPIAGGSSSTDLPIRTMIYPSYYKDDQGNPDEDGPAILLGSYTWANDAAKYSPYPQKENVKLCQKS